MILIRHEVKKLCARNGIMFGHLLRHVGITLFEFKQMTYAHVSKNGKFVPVRIISKKEIEKFELIIGNIENYSQKL